MHHDFPLEQKRHTDLAVFAPFYMEFGSGLTNSCCVFASTILYRHFYSWPHTHTFVLYDAWKYFCHSPNMLWNILDSDKLTMIIILLTKCLTILITILFLIFFLLGASVDFETLQMVIAGVWITSALYSIPKFIFSRTITNIHLNGISEEICIMHRGLFNSKLLDSINLSALYILPLLVMTVSLWMRPTRLHTACCFFFIRSRSKTMCTGTGVDGLMHCHAP